jgi:hypothetical protein
VSGNRRVYNLQDISMVHKLVSDQRWFWPKVSAEYSAETEYSARATETESENNVFSKIIFLEKSKNKK